MITSVQIHILRASESGIDIQYSYSVPCLDKMLEVKDRETQDPRDHLGQYFKDSDGGAQERHIFFYCVGHACGFYIALF